MAGVRYFRGAEVFDFDADLVNNAFGDDQVNELFYDIEVENHLIGFQLGGRLEYYLSSRFSLQAASKFGIYGNHIRQEQILWGGNGPAQIAAGSPLGNAGLSYVSDSTKNDVAFLGELAVGCAYDLTGHWRLTGGYRAVSLAGVAVPTGQIPQRFDDLVAVDQINSSDDLILHGAYGGLQFAW
jgi:hypothetical protein